MRLFLPLLLALSAAGCVNRTPPPAQFVIGAYSPDKNSDRDFEELKRSGFNTLITYDRTAPDHAKLLSRAEKHGMKVYLTMNRDLIGRDGGLEQMTAEVRKLKNHPALGGWYLYDEPAGKVTPELLAPFYRMLKRETPHLPVALVNCWDETFDRYSSVLDIQMVDIYPVRDEAFPAAPLQTLTNFVGDAVKLGKPVLPVVQTVSWNSFAEQLKGVDKAKLRYPEPAELRFFVFAPLTQGICGVFGYSYHHAMKTGGDPQWWKRVCAPVFLELQALSNLAVDLSAPEIFRRPGDGNIMAARFEAKEPGVFYLVAANAWPMEKKNAKCYLDGRLNGSYTLLPFGTTRRTGATLHDSQLRFGDTMRPWEVFVFKVTKDEKKK